MYIIWIDVSISPSFLPLGVYELRTAYWITEKETSLLLLLSPFRIHTVLVGPWYKRCVKTGTCNGRNHWHGFSPDAKGPHWISPMSHFPSLLVLYFLCGVFVWQPEIPQNHSLIQQETLRLNQSWSWLKIFYRVQVGKFFFGRWPNGNLDGIFCVRWRCLGLTNSGRENLIFCKKVTFNCQGGQSMGHLLWSILYVFVRKSICDETPRTHNCGNMTRLPSMAGIFWQHNFTNVSDVYVYAAFLRWIITKWDKEVGSVSPSSWDKVQYSY